MFLYFLSSQAFKIANQQSQCGTTCPRNLAGDQRVVVFNKWRLFILWERDQMSACQWPLIRNLTCLCLYKLWRSTLCLRHIPKLDPKQSDLMKSISQEQCEEHDNKNSWTSSVKNKIKVENYEQYFNRTGLVTANLVVFENIVGKISL